MERGNAVLEANDHVEHLIGKRKPDRVRLDPMAIGEIREPFPARD